ncbi:MAG: adenylosuccinate lyase [Acidobacteriota bacterium]
MIARYTRPQMGRIWTDENRFRKCLDVEIATAEVEADAKMIPRSAARDIKRKAVIDIERIREIEKEVKHDVVAFTTSVAERVGPSARYLHFGLTSYDVVDTALALMVRDASELIEEGLRGFGKVLRKRAFEFKDTVMVGRTHGIHAEPMTFGLKMALWYAENKRNLERMEAATEQMLVGKVSGAVGTYAHLSPTLERRICRKLGLNPAPISTQVLQRDRHAYYLTTLAVTAASLEKIGLEIRHLQRTEVREVEEFFSAGQKWSSAMPHKRNPITAEQMCGLARLVRSNAQAGLENVALWHERDISHSSVERVILPDSTILVDYMIAKTTDMIARLLVYPERMRENLSSMRGLVFSGQVLLDLAAKGASREEAYRWVQRSAMRVWDEDENFRDAIRNDADIAQFLGPEEIERSFSLARQFQHIDAIYRRVFGRS